VLEAPDRGALEGDADEPDDLDPTPTAATMTSSSPTATRRS
jgi:hypothetical protein